MAPTAVTRWLAPHASEGFLTTYPAQAITSHDDAVAAG
jgi:hypothetical protein